MRERGRGLAEVWAVRGVEPGCEAGPRERGGLGRGGGAVQSEKREVRAGPSAKKEGSGLGQTLGLGWVLGFLFPTLLLFYF